MARRVDKSGKAAAPSGAAASPGKPSELEVLHPERHVLIAGRSLVVREYGFVEGLKLRALIQPFLDGLYAVIAAGAGIPSFEQVQSVLAEHPDALVDMMAAAADVEPEWIRTLDDQDGEALLTNWWLANAGFFIRRVLRRANSDKLVAAALGGEGSTTPSSAPVTGARPKR